MELNYSLIAHRIRTLRKSRHMSQAELAEHAGLAVPYISHIETGRKKASLESLVRIADALEVTVNDLLSGNQKNDPDAFQRDLSELLNDCDGLERQFILESAAFTKLGLRKYIIMKDRMQ